MAFINESSVIAAYNKLSDDQRERFFPGKEYQAKRIVGSLCALLGDSCSYDQLLELYITAAVRAMMGFESERINITVKMRFSDIVPESKAITVIECIKRLNQNFTFIEKAISPEMQAFDKFFDTQNEAAFKRNDKRTEDAAAYPGFGIDPSNPIFAHSSAGSYSYLNLLYTADSVPLTWNRVGSMTLESSPDPIDQYELLLPNGDVYLTVYVNMYARKSSVYCPAGLRSDELKALPQASNNQQPESTAEHDDPAEEDEYLAFLRNYAKDSDQPSKKNSTSSETPPFPKTEKADAPQRQQSADEVLNESSVPILQGNIPIIHTKTAIYKKSDGSVYAICTFLPITDSTIRAMQVDVHCYDVWREPLTSVDRFQYLDLRTKREVAFGTDIIVPLPDPNTRNVDVVVRRVMFEDGTLLQREGDNLELPALKALDEHFANKELAEEYKKLTYQNARYTPVKVGAFWRCTCGAVNQGKESSCHRCKDGSSELFSWLDAGKLEASLSERKRRQREKEERERKAREEAQRKAEEEARVKAAREAEEARIRAEKKKQRNKIIAICAAAAAGLALVIYLIGWQFVPASKYKKADALLLAGDREAAYTAFSDLGRYKDSQDRASAIHYEDGEAAFSAGDYDEAYALFSSLGAYSDSSTQANESLYQKALGLMANASYENAAEIFESLGSYRDSRANGIACRNEKSYLEASALFEAGKYQEAGELFESLKTYQDSSSMMMQAYYLYAKGLIEEGKLHDAYLILSTKINKGGKSYEDSIELANTSEYQYAQDCFAAGEYDTAAESFANLKDYKDSSTRCLESKYQYGLQLISNGKYDDAEKLFTELSDYKDSAKQVNESIYQHGLALLEAKKYDDAIKVLGRLTNYRDSAKQLNEAQYQKALLLMGQKKYQDAEKIFSELGNYSDSAKQLKECKYQRALGLVKDKKYTQAVPIFKELGNYSDSIDQWKAAMYSYVLAHKNNNNETTYEYLQALSKANYKNCKEIYESLYVWTATIVINNSATDKTTKQSSISSYDTIYCHYTILGGPPGETFKLKAIARWPWGSNQTCKWNDNSYEWRRGDSGYTSWYFYSPADRSNQGTFTIKLYVGSVLIGEASIRVY